MKKILVKNVVRDMCKARNLFHRNFQLTKANLLIIIIKVKSFTPVQKEKIKFSSQTSDFENVFLLLEGKTMAHQFVKKNPTFIKLISNEHWFRRLL